MGSTTGYISRVLNLLYSDSLSEVRSELDHHSVLVRVTGDHLKAKTSPSRAFGKVRI
jgi:hypothetical protein